MSANANDNASRGLMIIGYKTKAPRTSVKDNRGTEAVANKFNADAGEVGNFTRRIISPEFLRERTRVINEFAGYHRDVTVPYGRAKAGTGIVMPEVAIAYKQTYRLSKREHDAAVKRIMGTYDEIVKAQKRISGDLFIPSADDPDRGVEIPSRQEFEDSFAFDIVEPTRLENPEDLLGILDKDEIEDVRKAVDAEIKESVTLSVTPAYKAIKKLAEGLNAYDPDAGRNTAFRKTLVTRVKDISDLLDTINFTNNEAITELKKAIDDNLIQYDEKALKEYKPLRESVAKKAEEILDENFGMFDL